MAEAISPFISTLGWTHVIEASIPPATPPSTARCLPEAGLQLLPLYLLLHPLHLLEGNDIVDVLGRLNGGVVKSDGVLVTVG